MNGVLLPNNIQNFRQFENNKLEYLNNENSTFDNAQGFEFFSSESSETESSKVTISDGFKEGDIINIKIITSLPRGSNKGKGYTSDDKTNLYYKFESLVIKKFLATTYLKDVKEDNIFVDFVELTNELNWIIKIYDSNEKILNTVKRVFTDKVLKNFFPMVADRKCPLPIGGLDLTVKDFNLVCQRLIVDFIACKIDFTTPNVLTAKTQLDEKIEGADKALEILKKQLLEPFESFTNPAGSGKEKFGETDENCIPDKEFPPGITDDVAGDTRMNNYITRGFAAGLAAGTQPKQVRIQGVEEITTAFNLYSEWLTKIKEWIAEPDQFNIYANIAEPNKLKREKEGAALQVQKIIDSPPTGDLAPSYFRLSSRTAREIRGIFALGGCTIKQRFNSYPNFKNLYDKCIDLYQSAVKLNLQQNYPEIKIPVDRAKEYLNKEENILTEWDNIKNEAFTLWIAKGQSYQVNNMYYDMAKAYNYIYEGQSRFFDRLRNNVRIINGSMGLKDTINNLTGAPNSKNGIIFANDISTYFRLVKPTTFDEFIKKVEAPPTKGPGPFWRINFWNPNDPRYKISGTVPVLMEEAYKNGVGNGLIPDDAEKKSAWTAFLNQIYYINRECVRASDRMNDKMTGVKQKGVAQIEFELIYSMIIAQKTVRECFYNALTGPDGKPNKLYSFVNEDDGKPPPTEYTNLLISYADMTDKLIRLDDENKKYEKDNKNLNLEKLIRQGILNIQNSQSRSIIVNGKLKNRITVNEDRKDGFEAALGVGDMPDRVELAKVMIAAELTNGEESINYPFITIVVQPFFAENKFLEIFKQKHLVDGKLNDNGLYYLNNLGTTSEENMKFFNKIAIAIKQAVRGFGKRREIELYTTPEKIRENKRLFIDDLKTRTEMYTNFEKLEDNIKEIDNILKTKPPADVTRLTAEKDKLTSMRDKINPATPPVLVVKDFGTIFAELSEEEQDSILENTPLDISVQPTIREMYDTFQLMEHINPRGTEFNGELKGLPKDVIDIYNSEGAPNVYNNSKNIFMYYQSPVWSFKRIFDNIEKNLRNTIYANIKDNYSLFLNDYYGLERDLTLKSIPESEKVMIRKLRDGEGGKGGYNEVFEKLKSFIIDYPRSGSKDDVIFYRYTDKKSFFDFNNLFNGGNPLPGFFAGNAYTQIMELPRINALKWPEVLEKIKKKCEELETVSNPNDKIEQLRTYLSTDIAEEYSPGKIYPFEYFPSQGGAVPPRTWAEYIIICQGLVARDSTTSVPVPGNKYLQKLFDSNKALYDAGELLKNEDLKKFPEIKYKYESALKLAISTIASLFDELNENKVDDIKFYYRIANTNNGKTDEVINKQIISAIYSDIEIDSAKLINLENLYLPGEISSAAFKNAEYIYNILIENGWNAQDPSIPGMDESKKLLELIKGLSPWDARGNVLDSRMMQFSFPFWGVMPPIENPTDLYLETSLNATVKVIEENAKHKNLRSILRQIDRLDKAIGDITSNFISTLTDEQNKKIAETIITLRQFLVESIGVIFPMFKNLFQNTPEDGDYLDTKEFAYIKNGKKTAEGKDIYHFSPSHNNDRPKTFTYKGIGRWPELDGSGDYGDMMNWEEVILQNPIEIPAKSKTIDNLKQYYDDLVKKTKQVSSITGPDLNLVSIYQNVGKFSPNMNIMVSIKLKFNKVADNTFTKENIKQLISEPLLSDFKIFQKNVYSSCDLFVTDLKNANKEYDKKYEDSMLKYDYSLKLVFYEVDNIAVYDGIYNYFKKRHEVLLGEIEKEGLQPFYKEFKKKVYNSELILTDGTKFTTTTIPIEVNNERFDAIKIINYTSFLNIKIRQFLVEEFKKSVLPLSEQYIQQGILLNNMYKFLGLMPKSIYEELDSVFTKIPNLMDKSFLTDVKPGVKLDESRNNNLFGFDKYLDTDYQMASLLLNFKFLSTGKHITDFQVGPIEGVTVDPLGKTKEVYGMVAGKFNDKDDKGVDKYTEGNKFLINDYAYTLVSLLRLKEIEILYENVEKNIKNYNDFGNTNFMANSNNEECESKSPQDVKINCLENMPNRRMIKNTFVSNIVEILDKIRGIIQIKIPKSKLNFTLDDYKTTVRMDGKTSRTDKMWTSMNDDGEVVLPADAPGGGVGIGGATPIVSDSIAIDRYKYTISFKSKVPYFKDEVNSCNYNGFYEKQSCRAFNNETWVYCGDIPYKKYDDSADDNIITKCNNDYNEESKNKDICKTFPQRGLDSNQINKLTDEGIFRNFYFGPSPMSMWPSITPEVCSPETEACMNVESCKRIYNYYNSRQPPGKSLPPFKETDENNKAPPGCYAKMKGDKGDEVEEIHYNIIPTDDIRRKIEPAHPWSAEVIDGRTKRIILNDPRAEDGVARNWYRQICGCDKINQIEENKNCNDSIPYPKKRMDNLVRDLNNKDVKNILIRKLYNVLAFQKRIVKIFETGESVTGDDALLIKDEFGKFTYDDKKHQIFIDYNVKKITNTGVEVKYIVNEKYINEGKLNDNVEVLDVYSGRQVLVKKENKRLNDIVKTSTNMENIIVDWDLEFFNYRESEFQILYKYFKDSNNLDILLSEVYNNECLNELLPSENKKNGRWPCAILSSNRINTNNNFTPYYVESKGEDLNVKQLDLEICQEFDKCDAGSTSHKIDESSQAHKIIEGKDETEKKALCCRKKTCKDELKHLSIFKLDKVDCTNDKGYVNVSKNTNFGNSKTETYFNKKTPEASPENPQPCPRAYVEGGPTWKDRPITPFKPDDPEGNVLKSCCKPITCKDIEIGTLIPDGQEDKAGVNNKIILSSCSTAEKSDGTGYIFNEDKKCSIPVIDSSISDVNERMIDYKNKIQTECCEEYTCDTYINKLGNTCSVSQLPIDNLKEPPVDGNTANCCRAKTCRDIKLGNIEGGSDTMCEDLGMKDNLTVDGEVVETPCGQCITTNPRFANITHKNCCKPKTCKDYRDEGEKCVNGRVKPGSDGEENLKKGVDGRIVEITEADKQLFINEKCCERLTCEESLQNIMESDEAFKGKSRKAVTMSFCNRTDINVKANINAVFNYVEDPTKVSVKYTGSDTSEYNQIAESCCVEQGKRKCSELQNTIGMCKVEDSNRLDPTKENDEKLYVGDVELAYYKTCCSPLTCSDYKNGFMIKSGDDPKRFEGTFNNVAEIGKLENISYVDGSGKTIIDENSKFNPETAGDEVKITELSKCTTAKTCQDYNRNGTVNVCGDNNGLEYNSNNNETIVEANAGCEGKTGEELFACKCCEIKRCGDFKLNNCDNSGKAYIKSQLNERPKNVEDFENQCCRNRTCIEHKEETNFECDNGFTLNTDVKGGVDASAVKEQCCREKVCSKDIICSGKNLNNNDDSIKGTEVNEKNCCTILQCEDNFDCDDDKEKIKYASYNTKVSTTKDEINAKCCKSKLDQLVSTKILVITTEEVLKKLIERYQSLTVNFNTVTDNFENSFVKLVNSVIPKSGDIDLIKIEQTNVSIKEIKKEDLPADMKFLEKYEAVGAKVGGNKFAEIDFTVSDLNTQSRIFLEGLFTTVLNIKTMQKVFDTSFDLCCREYKDTNCNKEDHPCQLFKGKIEELTLNGKVLEEAKEVPTEPSKKYYNRGVIAGIVSVSSLFLIIVISMVIYLIVNRNDFVKFVENLLLKFTN